jgi:hypothetical protein
MTYSPLTVQQLSIQLGFGKLGFHSYEIYESELLQRRIWGF